jgi:hypothetical protein
MAHTVARRVIRYSPISGHGWGGAGYARTMPDPTQPPRRFPPPWTVEETAPCFIVRDALYAMPLSIHPSACPPRVCSQ